MRHMLTVIMSYCLTACTPAINPLNQDDANQNSSIQELIDSSNLRKADDMYLEQRGTNDSQDMSSIELELAKAHMNNGEYLLAIFYAKTILSQSNTQELSSDAAFVIVGSLFQRYKRHPSDENLGSKFDKMAQSYQNNYYSSTHFEEVNDYLLSYKSIKNQRYEDLANSYERQGKQQAAEFYREKIEE